MIRYLVSLVLAAALTVSPVRAAVIFINPYSHANFSGQDAFEIITALGETANLQFCLDAGDSTSYAGGADQTWNDLSGNGQDFFRGGNINVNAGDPTFNGSSGGLSSAEYFSFDGDDRFTYDSANETWMTNLHKENAVATFVFLFYGDTLGSPTQMLAGTMGDPVTGTGFRVNITTTNGIGWQVDNAGATVSDDNSVDEGGIITENAWNFLAVSVDEAIDTDGIIFHVNGSNYLDNSAYVSPSAGAASETLDLGAGGFLQSPLQATNRLAMVCAWSRALTAGSLDSIYAGFRGRVGI